MTQTRMIFTCIPNAGAPERPHLTVVVTPKLENPGDDTPRSLENWELSGRTWVRALQDAAAAGAIKVKIDGGAAVPVTLADPSALDEQLWQALFESTTTMVNPSPVPAQWKSDARVIRSFPAGELHDHLHKAYLNTAYYSPTEPAPLVHPDGSPTDLGGFVGELIRARHHLHGDSALPFRDEDTFVWEKPDGVHYAPRRAFYLANRFYLRRPPWSPVPLGPPPAPAAHDFHARVAQLGDHPALLRGTGLAFDVLLPPGSLSLDGTVQLDLAWRPATNPPLDHFPITHYLVKNGRFLPRPAFGIDLLDGYLRLDAIAGDTPVFRVLQLDVDGAAQQSIAFASAIAGQVGDVTRPPQTTTTLPSLRTAGLTLTRYNRDLWLQWMRDRAQDINDHLPTPELFAEDLLRGFRVDVEVDGDGVWRTLCARTGTISVFDYKDLPVPAQEGYVKAASGASADSPDPGVKPEMFLHEAIAGWDGWSLVARKPGKAVKFDGSHEVIVDGETGSNGGSISVTPDTRFRASYKPVAGTLPKLRFGRSYRLRARVADLAGGGIGSGDTNATHTTPPVIYGRYEPIAAPVLVPRAPVTDGESVERLVVRSGDPPAGGGGPVLDRPQPIGDDPPPATNARHLVPPKSTLAMAEAHGLLDGAFAAGADPRWYAVACKEKGSLADVSIIDPDAPLVNGVPSEVAVTGAVLCNPPSSLSAPPDLASWPKGTPLQAGQYVIHTGDEIAIPYLPDPLARGVTLVDPAPAADSTGPSVIQLDYPATSLAWAGGALDTWPERRSLQLVLRQGTGSQIVRQAAGSDARTIVFELPPGRVLTLRYSSRPVDALTQLALWNELAKQLPAAALADLATIIRDGRHWMFTPPREVQLVHAVQRPVLPPRIEGYTLYRDPGDTIVRFGDTDAARGVVVSHSWSTSHVDLRAAWDDWVDDGKDPDGVRLERHTATAFRVAITAGQDTTPIVGATQGVQRVPGDGPLAVATPGPDQPPPQSTPSVHHVGDTKHHVVAYTPIGTTRYAEYFPAALIADHTNLETIGVQRIEEIESTVAPPEPKVLYAVPTFRWEDVPQGRRRVGGGVRVYLDRPWFVSGEGERLAVVLPFDGPPPTPTTQDHVTRWGTDPAWSSAAPPPLASAFTLTGDSITYFAGTDHVYSARRAITGTAPLPIGRWDQYPVIGYLPEWNAERQLWYVDIEVDPGAAYWPFISLALARWQPISLGGITTSKVVRCQFAQLAPHRACTAVPSGNNVAITLTGISAGNSLEALGDVPGPRLQLRPRRWIHDDTLAGAHRAYARVEQLDASLDPTSPANQLRWKAIGQPLELKASIGQAYPEVQWRGTVAIPTDPGHYRVVVTESEIYESDTGTIVYREDGSGALGRERVVYMDSFAVAPA